MASSIFLAGGLLELGEVDVADAGTNLVLEIDGGMRNFVAHEIEDERLGLAITNGCHLDMRTLGPFERLGHQVGTHAVSRFAIDRRDDVTGTNAGAE